MTTRTLSNKESVAFSAPSGLPKGNEYLQKVHKLYSDVRSFTGFTVYTQFYQGGRPVKR